MKYDIVIPFSLTPAVLDAADAAAVTLITFGTNANLARVPRLLQLHLPAGDAYTVGAGSRLEFKDNNGVVEFSVPAEGLLDQTTEQKLVVLPSAANRVVKAGTTSLTLLSTGNLAKGTASSTLSGRLYLDEIGFQLA